MKLSQVIINLPGQSESYEYGTILGSTISRLLVYAIAAAGMFFLYRLVSGGFSLMTSGGDPGKIQTAKKELTNGLIGVIIIIFTYSITQIIQAIFGLNIIPSP